MEAIKVTVVVPVYNVEAYLGRCMASLLGQTYENYEILLVDDGATDRSGIMCEAYASQHQKVTALRKENGGLSDARNYAIAHMAGDYVAYVDPDDYVDREFLDKMVGCLYWEGGSKLPDMAVCPHVDELPDGRELTHRAGEETVQVYTAEQALSCMCYEQKFGTSACAKLISRRLAKKYLFPPGKLYEDLATVHKMIGDSNQVAYIGRPMYHYVQHSGSIRKSGWKPNVMDLMDGAQQLMDYIDRQFPRIHQDGVQRYFFSANEVYVRAFDEKDYLSIVRPVRDRLLALWGDIRRNKKVPPRQKGRYWMLIHCPVAYRALWKLAHKEWR